MNELPVAVIRAAHDLQRRGFSAGSGPGYAQHDREIGYQLIAEDEWMALALLELQRTAPRVASLPTSLTAVQVAMPQELPTSGADPAVNGILTRVCGTYVADGAAMLSTCRA
jgi:hypothetical protein